MSNGKNLDFRLAKSRSNDDVQVKDIDLSEARTKPEKINISGSQLYICQNVYSDDYEVDATKTVGFAVITLNSPNGSPIELNKGQHLNFDVAVDAIYLRNTAQSGKGMRLQMTTDTTINPFAANVDVDLGVDIVESGGTNSLRIYDENIADLRALMMGLDEEGYYLTKGFVDLRGCTYASVANTTLELVSAAANTDGVIIARADLIDYTSAIYSSILIDGNKIGGSQIVSERKEFSLENYYIPAGVKVDMVSLNATYRGQCWYKVL